MNEKNGKEQKLTVVIGYTGLRIVNNNTLLGCSGSLSTKKQKL